MLVVPAWQEEQWGCDNQERGELEPKLLSKINQTKGCVSQTSWIPLWERAV